MRVRSSTALLVALLAATLALTACGGSAGSDSGGSGGSGSGSGSGSGAGSGSSSSPAYELVYDANLCQVWRATTPSGIPSLDEIPGTYCAALAPDNPNAFDFYFQTPPGAHGATPYYRQEYGAANAGYNVQKYITDNTWVRSPVDDPTNIELCWRPDKNSGCHWLAPVVYGATVQAQLDQQAAAEAQASADDARQTHAEHAAAAQAQIDRFNASRDRLSGIWARPECDSSYNGCL